MKKIYTAILTTLFIFGFYLTPAFAIVEKKPKKEKQEVKTSVIEDINLDWWKNLNDSYLESYIMRAIENNHDIKSAQLKLEEANLNVTMTRSNQLPQFSVGFSPAVAKFPTMTNSNGSFAIPLIASYELDIFGKNWDKTKSSKKIAKSAQYQAQVSNIAIVSMVGTTYYNVVKLDKLIELQEELVKNRKEIYDLMKISNEEGLSSTSDLILSEKNYVLSQNDLIEYKKSRENALNALAVLIGDSPNNTKEYERISLDELDNNFEIPSEISSEIIVNRPDYKALENQLEAKGIDIRVAKKEFLPTIDILGMLSFVAASSLSGGMDWKNAFAFASGSAMLPVFTGFRRIANLKLSKNYYQQILEEYQKTNLSAMQEVNDSLYNLKSNKEKSDNNKKALDIQDRDYQISKKKFDEGVISKLDLLQQKEALLYIEQLSATSKTDCYISKIGLYKATGAKV